MKTITKTLILASFALSFHSFAQTDKVVSAFAKSYEYEGKRDYATAIKNLKDVYDNESYEENLRLGWLNYKAADYNQSMQYYQNAMNIMPYALEAKQGYCYPLASANDLEKLIAHYTKILEVDPLDRNANYQLGFYYYNKGKMDVAKKYFEKIISMYPSGYDTYLLKAWNKMNNILPQPDKVIVAFSHSYDFEYKADYIAAISVLKEVYDKNYYDVNLRLGWLNYKAERYTESANYYKIATDLKPNAVEPRLGYTYPLSSLGNTDQLIEQYKKIIELNPQNTAANYNLGLIYYNKEDYSNAFKHFEKVVNLYPFDYDGLLMYAWANYRTEKAREAKVLFNKVLMLSPGNASALQGLALIK